MKKRLLGYFKHLLLTIAIFIPALILFGISQGASLHYADDPLAMDWDQDGPYVFYTENGGLSINHIRGSMEDGFVLEQEFARADTPVPVRTSFPLDATSFHFSLQTGFATPPTSYQGDYPVLAISDIESGFRTLRDFLINNGVVDARLNWTFSKGYLVLSGDFVDRGESATQVLWFIYKLEQEAAQRGGRVHYILGNHEIKNLQGIHEYASMKYFHVASILGKHQHELCGPDSFLGRWLASKNTIEKINGYLLIHGGLHPDIAGTDLNLNDINRIVRAHYTRPYYPKPDESPGQLLISTETAPSWYRGYFKNRISQDEVNAGLDKFGARSVVVGHKLQHKVNKSFDGKVIGIDVNHPSDFHKNWPAYDSEGLLIDGDKLYRAFHDGERELL